MRTAVLVFTVCVGVALGNVCNIFSAGHWTSSQAAGVTDFAYGGSALNDNYFCFDGCLATQAIVTSMKVNLANVTAPRVFKRRNLYNRKPINDDDDPNAFGCIDPTLRADIANALTKVTQPTAKAVLQALQYNLKTVTGWAITVTSFNFDASEIVQDFNFCDYDAEAQGVYWSIEMAKLDMS